MTEHMIPLIGKLPACRGHSWKTCGLDHPDIATGAGRVLEGLTVIDVDDPLRYRQWLDRMEQTVPIVKTPRGLHLYLRGEIIAFKASGVDIKSGLGHYVVSPPARATGGSIQISQCPRPPIPGLITTSSDSYGSRPSTAADGDPARPTTR